MDNEFSFKVLKVITSQSKWTKIILTVIVIILVFFLIIQRAMNYRELAGQLKTLTAVKDDLILNDCPVVEQKDKYRKMMIRIFDVYGYKYDNTFTKAMDPKEQADFIDLTFRLDDILWFNHYEVPTIALMETYFNPKAHNQTSGLDEKGLFQQCFETALYAVKTLLPMMPDIYQKELKVDLKCSDDLYSWETSTKIAYILLWWHRRDFPQPEWWISIYHWGDFLSRYWDDGKGRIPDSFTINGMKYSVIAYFSSWMKLIYCFSSGDLEPGREVMEKWQAYQKNLMAEEIQFRTARTIIRKLQSELEEKKYYEKTLTDKYQEIDKSITEGLDSIQKIYWDASKQTTGEKIKTKLNNAKQTIKKMLVTIRSNI